MSVQIAVRLPDDIAAFVDAEVASGRATSRAAVVSRALVRERRRLTAERDIAVLAGSGRAELDDLARHAASVPLDVE